MCRGLLIYREPEVSRGRSAAGPVGGAEWARRAKGVPLLAHLSSRLETQGVSGFVSKPVGPPEIAGRDIPGPAPQVVKLDVDSQGEKPPAAVKRIRSFATPFGLRPPSSSWKTTWDVKHAANTA